MTEQTPDPRTFSTELVRPKLTIAREHGLGSEPIRVVYFPAGRHAWEPAPWGYVATLRREGRQVIVEPHNGAASFRVGAGKSLFAAPVPPMPRRPCVNAMHAEATHVVRFSDGTSEECCERHARVYRVGESFRTGQAEITAVSVEPIRICASCPQDATHVAVLDTDDKGTVREDCCEFHRVRYYAPGAVYPDFPAHPANPKFDLPAVPATPGFRVLSIEPIVSSEKVAEISAQTVNLFAEVTRTQEPLRRTPVVINDDGAAVHVPMAETLSSTPGTVIWVGINTYLVEYRFGGPTVSGVQPSAVLIPVPFPTVLPTPVSVHLWIGSRVYLGTTDRPGHTFHVREAIGNPVLTLVCEYCNESVVDDEIPVLTEDPRTHDIVPLHGSCADARADD
jgi:hypothetical protein